MKAKIVTAHAPECWAKKKYNPWSGGLFQESVPRDAIFRRGGNRYWFIWCCADPDCPAQVAIRYDPMAAFINKMARSAKPSPRKPKQKGGQE